MLTQRWGKSGSPNPLNLVFPASTGTIIDANNVGEAWRYAADSLGYHRVAIRTLRESNATAVARTLSAEAAAYQLGHSQIAMTQEHYMEDYKDAVDTRAAFNGLSSPMDTAPKTSWSCAGHGF